jgi:oligoendopeptidase F
VATARTPTPARADGELERARWDLEPLVGGAGAEGARTQLAEALRRADAFARRYEGEVAELDADGVAAAMAELEAIYELEGRADSYASLSFSIDTADPERGALLQHAQEAGTALQTRLLFFDLEWTAIEDEAADRLLAAAELEPYRHHLRSARRYRPHLLSQPEERILSERELTARAAWTRLYTEQVSSLRVDLPEVARQPGDPDGPVALEIALSRLLSTERAARRASAEAVTAALQDGLRVRSYIFNTLMADKATTDRLRRYPHWLASRNLDNEASDESVQALLEAVRARCDLPRRWYRLKAGLLGLDRLADYDRSAPLGSEPEAQIPWSSARELVLDSYREFSPRLGELVEGFLGGGYIDAPVVPDKRGGAFCAYTVPSAHPYILLNYTGTRRDVLTLAHELGHGVHAALARPQGVFHFSTPLTVAETASTFGEQLVFERLLAGTEDRGARLRLLGEAIDDAVATVFRQVAMNRFEHLCHTRRREQGELSVQAFAELWIESQREMMGDSVQLTDGYADWHSYVSHFIAAPGYVYAYAYGQLLALSVYEAYRERGAELVPRLLEMLAAGGSRSPEELAAIVGIDLSDPGFWDRGLRLIEAQLEQAEALAGAANPRR